LDASGAHKDWGWAHEYDMTTMTSTMLNVLSDELGLVADGVEAFPTAMQA